MIGNNRLFTMGSSLERGGVLPFDQSQNKSARDNQGKAKWFSSFRELPVYYSVTEVTRGETENIPHKLEKKM